MDISTFYSRTDFIYFYVQQTEQLVWSQWPADIVKQYEENDVGNRAGVNIFRSNYIFFPATFWKSSSTPSCERNLRVQEKANNNTVFITIFC